MVFHGDLSANTLFEAGPFVGDRRIEIETEMAYDHASKNASAISEAQTFSPSTLADETRHKDYRDAQAAV